MMFCTIESFRWCLKKFLFYISIYNTILVHKKCTYELSSRCRLLNSQFSSREPAFPIWYRWRDRFLHYQLLNLYQNHLKTGMTNISNFKYNSYHGFQINRLEQRLNIAAFCTTKALKLSLSNHGNWNINYSSIH